MAVDIGNDPRSESNTASDVVTLKAFKTENSDRMDICCECNPGKTSNSDIVYGAQNVKFDERSTNDTGTFKGTNPANVQQDCGDVRMTDVTLKESDQIETLGSEHTGNRTTFFPVTINFDSATNFNVYIFNYSPTRTTCDGSSGNPLSQIRPENDLKSGGDTEMKDLNAYDLIDSESDQDRQTQSVCVEMLQELSLDTGTANQRTANSHVHSETNNHLPDRLAEGSIPELG